MSEADERCSPVRNEQQAWRAWVALDADARQVRARAVGDRSEATARRRWEALPAEYRDGAIVCTDLWSAYRAVVPAGRHAAGGKGDGITNPVGRFWCAVRQRCRRLVRTTPPFSACLRSHIGALGYFIRYYNASRR